MKRNWFHFAQVVLLLGMVSIFSATNQPLIAPNNLSNMEKAQYYLNRNGEVYFKFFHRSYTDLIQLSNMISIDNIVGSEIYAYANMREFTDFIEKRYNFTTLIPPSALIPPPEMYTGGKKDPNRFEYPTYDAYVELMGKYEKDYPDLCKLIEFGKSNNGRKLLALKISDKVNEAEKEPLFLFYGTIHGDETAGYGFMLLLIEELVKGYGHDARSTNLVDNMEIWIAPLTNPDGTYKGGNNSVQGSTRGNGNGVDLNRDYPDPKRAESYDEQYSRAQAETKATIDFGNKYPFVMSADWHGGVELACFPWGHENKKTADDKWWRYVGGQYKELAQENGSSNYFTDENGLIMGADWYIVHGERMGHALGYQYCRNLCLEVSKAKTLSASSVPTYWGYNKKATYEYMGQVLNGINGTVIDSLTGEGIKAKVFVESHDKDNTHVFSKLPHGDFYRPIYEGTYDVTFTHKDYFPKTISGIKVENDKGTTIEVKLLSKVTQNTQSLMEWQKNNVRIIQHHTNITIEYLHQDIQQLPNIANIYSASGRLITSIKRNNTIFRWNKCDKTGRNVGHGLYILRVSYKDGIVSDYRIVLN